MVISSYQQTFEKVAERWVFSLEEDSVFKKAASYALLNQGKRLRPSICLMVADGLGSEDVSCAALAIELFHTASLIADDLPCMDDDAERRSKPTLHKAFNEPLALLTSYAFIAAGFECLANQSLQKEPDAPVVKDAGKRGLLALKNVSYNTGFAGACGGQLMDLFPPDSSLETLKEIIHKKTGVLFEIAFVLGWIFGGGALASLDRVKECAYHFGQAFQIQDDIGDFEQDSQANKVANIAVLKGKELASVYLQEEIEKYQICLKALGLDNSPLNSLLNSNV